MCRKYSVVEIDRMVFFSLCVDLCWFIWLSCGYHWSAAEAAVGL